VPPAVVAQPRRGRAGGRCAGQARKSARRARRFCIGLLRFWRLARLPPLRSPPHRTCRTAAARRRRSCAPLARAPPPHALRRRLARRVRLPHAPAKRFRSHTLSACAPRRRRALYQSGLEVSCGGQRDFRLWEGVPGHSRHLVALHRAAILFWDALDATGYRTACHRRERRVAARGSAAARCAHAEQCGTARPRLRAFTLACAHARCVALTPRLCPHQAPRAVGLPVCARGAAVSRVLCAARAAAGRAAALLHCPALARLAGRLRAHRRHGPRRARLG
jgi:hypothetical protein